MNAKTGSFKVEVIADNSGKWCGNALRFASEAAAKDYAEGLYMRWTLVQEWRVVPCADPPEPNCYEPQDSEHTHD